MIVINIYNLKIFRRIKIYIINMNLIELLGKYKATGENEKTHTIIPNLKNKEYKFGGTYSFSKDLVKSSCDMFYEYFIINKGKLSITEAIPDICPLYIDLDLEFDGSSKLRQYTHKTIDLLVEFINREIRNNMDIDGNIECYVQEATLLVFRDLVCDSPRKFNELSELLRSIKEKERSD